MPNFFQTIGSVEPCDGRDLLQKLSYLVVSEVSKKKAQLCDNIAESFSDFGIENFSPCNLLTDTTLNQLLEGDSEGVINYLLSLRALPPHTYKILKSGYNSLEEREKTDLDKYLSSLALNYVRGEVEPIIREKIAEVIKCPEKETVKRLQVKLENTTRTVNSLLDKVTRLDKYITPTSATVSLLNQAFKAADTTILALDVTLPVIAATPTGASGIIARVIGKVERFIDNNRGNVEKLDDNLCNAAKAVRFAKTQLLIIQTLLQLLDIMLRACLIEKGEDPQVLSEFTPISFERTRQTVEYRGYILEIRTDVNDFGIAPRRYAVALDPVGVIVLQGNPSFSSNTEILIEELKFRIDNQLG